MVVIKVTPSPPPTLVKQLQHQFAARLPAVAKALTPSTTTTRVGVFCVQDNTCLGICLGGMTGRILSSPSKTVAKIDTLFLSPSLRGQRVGSSILQAFESAASAASATSISLVSLSYQAPKFYKRNGYTAVHEQQGWPGSASNVWLEKTLDDASSSSSGTPETTQTGEGGWSLVTQVGEEEINEEFVAVVEEGLSGHNAKAWEAMSLPFSPTSPTAPAPGVGPSILVTASLPPAEGEGGEEVVGMVYGSRMFDFFQISLLAVDPSHTRTYVATSMMASLRQHLLDASPWDRTRVLTLTVPPLLAEDEGLASALSSMSFVKTFDSPDKHGVLWEGASAGALAVVEEVESLHRFFTSWFNGTLPDQDDAFARFPDRTADEFFIVQPGGVEYDREGIVARVRGLYGFAADSPVLISVENVRVTRVRNTYSTFLVSYEEWQGPQEGGDGGGEGGEGVERKGRRSSALFSFTSGGGGGGVMPLWLSVHETWLPEAVN